MHEDTRIFGHPSSIRSELEDEVVTEALRKVRPRHHYVPAQPAKRARQDRSHFDLLSN